MSRISFGFSGERCIASANLCIAKSNIVGSGCADLVFAVHHGFLVRGGQAQSACTHLDLSNVRRHGLSWDSFSGLTRLVSLILSNNQLVDLPAGVFSILTSLLHLHLNNNLLQSLPVDICTGPKLKELTAEQNKLHSLPETIFDNCTNLTRLILGSNDFSSLSSLPEKIFRGLDNLYFLSLYNARIQMLPMGIFDGMTINRLDLSDNPVLCILDGYQTKAMVLDSSCQPCVSWSTEATCPFRCYWDGALCREYHWIDTSNAGFCHSDHVLSNGLTTAGCTTVIHSNASGACLSSRVICSIYRFSAFSIFEQPLHQNQSHVCVCGQECRIEIQGGISDFISTTQMKVFQPQSSNDGMLLDFSSTCTLGANKVPKQ